MGKNKKPRNVVQCHIQNGLGTGNDHEGILNGNISDAASACVSKNDGIKSIDVSNLGEKLQRTANNLSSTVDNVQIHESQNVTSELPDDNIPKIPILINGLDESLLSEGKKESPKDDDQALSNCLSGNFNCSTDLKGFPSNPCQNNLGKSVDLLNNGVSELDIDKSQTECLFQSKSIPSSVSECSLNSSSSVDACCLAPHDNTINNEHGGFPCVENENGTTGKKPNDEFQGTKKPKSSAQKRKERKAKALSQTLNGQAGALDSNENEILKSECAEKTACDDEKKKKAKNACEVDKRGKKKPSKKQLALIHEALKKAKEDEERQRKEEETKRKMAEEAEKQRLEKLRLEQEKKEMKKLKEKKRKEKARAEGRLLSKSQKQARARMEATLAALRQQGVEVPQICDKKASEPNRPRLGSKSFQRRRVDSCQSTNSCDSAIVISERCKYESFSSQESCGKDSLSDFPSSLESTEESSLTIESDKNIFFSDESDDTGVISKRKKSFSESSVILPKKESPKLRSPVVCVLGHVDTGKTKILDQIRKTHVQDSEAGGITQQIGATMIPSYALHEKCKMVKGFSSFELKIPGLLVIDTPGHESFSNLRCRGSSICDIAILVVDIMHGLEPQTIESINLLKAGKTPFVVALNKVDRLYGWQSSKDVDIETTLKNQSTITQAEFQKRCQKIILEFANLCLNAALFYENNDSRSFVSMVPVSAVTGDGMGNLLSLIAQLTQSIMPKRLVFSEKLEAIVLEVKAIPGLGTTIDVILVNGHLREGDTIVLAGQEGPIVTQIRSLLMPQPLKELRVKNPYTEHKVIEGAQGVKITARDLEKAVAGVPLYVADSPAMVETLKNDLNRLYRDAMNSFRMAERGVYVQASTLGSLEALLDFLTSSGVPYFSVKIGPVVKKDVMKASIMLEHDVMYAAILAFDVKVERDAQELADNLGVRIFHADIIYHLFDMYDKYREELKFKKRQLAVFPCKLRIDPDAVVSVKDPLVLGVHVEAGILREDTPLCVVHKDIIDIGVVSSIELGSNKVPCAKKGDDVRITVNTKTGDSPKTYGKHFGHEDVLVSRISRQSIDVCKELFRHELQPSDWHLMVELKKLLHIM